MICVIPLAILLVWCDMSDFQVTLVVKFRIYLGGVKEGITEENVKEYFEANFTCKVENVDLIKNKEGEEPKLRYLKFCYL